MAHLGLFSFGGRTFFGRNAKTTKVTQMRTSVRPLVVPDSSSIENNEFIVAEMWAFHITAGEQQSFVGIIFGFNVFVDVCN